MTFSRCFSSLIFLTITLSHWPSASGHGRLIEPPSRASAWRYGFATPHNYNDHELYCGGFSRQWAKNGGNCGICGDAWDQKTPRPHEFGGRFGLGVIVRRYLINSVITLRVELTANHNGYFEFRLCPENKNTTQECLNKYVLEAYNGPDAKEGQIVTKYYPKDGNRIYEMQYKLPKDLTCEHCLIQWRYIAGNNWGTCEDGTGAVGCGNQEEFRACSDVAIGLTGESVIPTIPSILKSRLPYDIPTRKTTTHKSTTSDTTESSGVSTESPIEQDSHSSLVGFLIAILTLVVVLVVMSLFYLYYYRGGRRIKNLLMKGTKKQKPLEAPVRPPRLKKSASTVGDTILTLAPKTDIDNNIEPGFENIKLNDHRI